MSGLHPKKTIVPFDFSELSMAAVERALEIAGDDGDIEVVHVLAELNPMEPGLLFGTMPDEKRMASIDNALRETFPDEKYAKLGMHCLIGDAGRKIAQFAKHQGADLIVMPSHGYGFVKHVLLGSVAERVVRLAHCPVLVLRT